MQYLPSPLLGAFVFIFGLIIGSFENVVIHRVPRRESIVFPGSHCPACNEAISAFDNVPLLSYIVLGGKCRSCSARISPVYPAVELLVALLFLFCYLRDGWSLLLVADLVFVGLIVPLVFIDFYHQILPNVITYPGLLVLLALRVLAPDPWIVAHAPQFFGLAGASPRMLTLAAAVAGALVGGGSLWVVREAYFRLRGIEGMGLGDIKMMLMAGAFLGWQLTLLTIFVGSLLGSIAGLILIKVRGGTLKLAIPFGVFLGPAGIIALFLGPQIWDLYVGMYR